MKQEIFERLVQIRRELHANPELGYQERETAKLITRELDRMGIGYRTGIAGTGVVADMKKGDGPLIVLRADMDALPIREETSLPFKSSKVMQDAQGRQIPLMHACGHDIHTTMVLGAAELLKDMPFQGTVRFIFQPSEEGVYDDPEHKSGGQRMVEAGMVDGASAALGLHVHPLLPAGKVAYKLGQALACANFFKITVKGRMAHAAVAPHLGIDAVLVASQLITSASAIAHKYTAPHEPTVISFTQIHGGIAPNVIADKVVIEGTVRAIDLSTFDTIRARLEKIIAATAASFDAAIDIEYQLSYPSLLNDKNIHQKMTPVLNEVFQPGDVIPIDAILGSEDFAFYSRKVPSMFYFLGAQDTAEKCYFLHDSRVVFNESCIPYGSKLLANGAVSLLDQFGQSNK